MGDAEEGCDFCEAWGCAVEAVVTAEFGDAPEGAPDGPFFRGEGLRCFFSAVHGMTGRVAVRGSLVPWRIWSASASRQWTMASAASQLRMAIAARVARKRRMSSRMSMVVGG